MAASHKHFTIRINHHIWVGWKMWQSISEISIAYLICLLSDTTLHLMRMKMSIVPCEQQSFTSFIYLFACGRQCKRRGKWTNARLLQFHSWVMDRNLLNHLTLFFDLLSASSHSFNWTVFSLLFIAVAANAAFLPEIGHESLTMKRQSINWVVGLQFNQSFSAS